MQVGGFIQIMKYQKKEDLKSIILFWKYVRNIAFKPILRTSKSLEICKNGSYFQRKEIVNEIYDLMAHISNQLEICTSLEFKGFHPNIQNNFECP